MAERMVLGGVTRDKLDEARRQIKEASGMDLTGDAAVIKHGAYLASYSYNEAAAELTLILEKKPRLKPMWAIRMYILSRVKDFGIYEVKL